MTKRRSYSRKQRAEIFLSADGICHICAGKITSSIEKWEVEHIIPLELGGEDGGSNLAPAHYKCHKTKTKGDVKQIAKAKRVAAKHNGTFRQSANPLPAGRFSKLKRKVGGGVVPREED